MGKIKQISRVGVFHPKSRKAQRVKSKIQRTNKLNKQKQATRSKIKPRYDMYLFVHDYINNDYKHKKSITYEEAVVIIFNYLFKKDYKKSHGNKVSFMKLLVEKEKKDFNTIGISIPDLTIKKTLSNFRQWNRRSSSMGNFKTKNFSNLDKNGNYIQPI